MRRMLPAAVVLGALVAAATPTGEPRPAVSAGKVVPAAPAASPARIATPLPTTVPTPAPTPVPTSSPTPTAAPSSRQAAPLPPVHAGPLFAVGDSVTIDIAGDLQRDVPGTAIDGKVGRQFSAGIDIVDGLRSAGRLPPTVVVALGTNGTVTAQQFDAMMRAASGATHVVFVTVRVPRFWQDEDNRVLRAGVARYPITRLADWFALSAGHPEWFAPDGYHLTRSGSQALAQLVAAALAG